MAAPLVNSAALDTPLPGRTVEVRPGIHWARIDLPLRLNHVNVWLLEDGEGWALVDAGFDTPEIRTAFDAIFAATLGDRPITRVILTHGHPDHVGIAGTIVRRFGATLHMTLAEWLCWRMRHLECLAEATPHAPGFYRGHGVAPEEAERMAAEQKFFTHYYQDPVPTELHRIADGDVLNIGGRRWTAVTASGHAPEHLSLYCAEERLLIAGDHILGRITPIIGVFPMEPEDDPLAQYLRSLARFAALDPATFVLPGHGSPFGDLGGRLAFLAEHHEERLDAFRRAADRPRPALELAAAVFPPHVMAGAARLALFETVAHLNCLLGRGRMRRIAGQDGILRFVAA